MCCVLLVNPRKFYIYMFLFIYVYSHYLYINASSMQITFLCHLEDGRQDWRLTETF